MRRGRVSAEWPASHSEGKQQQQQQQWEEAGGGRLIGPIEEVNPLENLLREPFI